MPAPSTVSTSRPPATVESQLVPKPLEAQAALEPLQRAQPLATPPPSSPAATSSPEPPTQLTDVTAAIVKWANYYHVDAGWMLRVAKCESGYNQAATNYGYTAGGGHPHGIFQFLPQTFVGNGGRDYESYDDQARVAAYMFSIGEWTQWECR